MSPPMQNPAKFEIRTVICFLYAEDTKAVEIHRQISKVYGGNIMNDAMIWKWGSAFKAGQTNVLNEG